MDLTFVTDNSKDFLNKDGTALAPDLMADLREAGLPTDQVRLITDLVTVISEYLPENPEAMNAFRTFAHSLKGRDRVKETIDHFFEVERRVPLIAKPGVLPHWLLEQDIEGLQSVVEVTTESARPLEANTFLVTGQIEGLAYIGGVVWAQSFGPRSRSKDRGGCGTPWVSSTTSPIRSHNRSRPTSAPDSVCLPTSRTFTSIKQYCSDHLAPRPQYARATPPAADASLLEQARWLEVELSRPQRITGREYLWAISDEAFIHDLTAALVTLEAGVAEHLTQSQSIPLAPDNLVSILEERAGVRTAHDALELLIDRLEADEP